MKTLKLLPLIAFLATPAVSGLPISLANLPVVQKDTELGATGPLPDLLRLIEEYYPEDFSFEVYPFGRSIANVATGSYEAHAPLIAVGTPSDFQFVDEPLNYVSFVIYSSDDTPVTADSAFSSLTVETAAGHAQFFDFEVSENPSIESALKKVASGRVDAFIMAQESTDHLLKSGDFPGIHRALFAELPASVIVTKGERGDALNEALTKAIRAAKKDPRYAVLSAKFHAPFEDWQP